MTTWSCSWRNPPSLLGLGADLLSPALKKCGAAKTGKHGCCLHSRPDDVISFDDHRLADPEPLAAMLGACGGNDYNPLTSHREQPIQQRNNPVTMSTALAETEMVRL